MEVETVVAIMREALLLALLVSAPLLLTALLLGVAISMLQAVTQIQEQTLSFVPKLFAMGAVAALMLPWALQQISEHFVRLLRFLPMVAG